jgi:hypothetical protein
VPPPAAKRVTIIRGRGQCLGSVESPDRERAEAFPVKEFNLNPEQRRRLPIRAALTVRTLRRMRSRPSGEE